MIHSAWATWLFIIGANLSLIGWSLRKAAREAGRPDWIRACWEVRRKLILPRRFWNE